MVVGKDINWINEFSYEIFVLNNSVFCNFSFLLAEDCKMWGRHTFLHRVKTKVVFILKISCFLFTKYLQLPLKGFSLLVHRHGSQKYKNFAFALYIEFTFSCAIQEKFTAWRVNLLSNFSGKTDITLIALRDSCDVTLFSHEVWRGIHQCQAVNFSIKSQSYRYFRLSMVCTKGLSSLDLEKHIMNCMLYNKCIHFLSLLCQQI